MPLTSNGPGQLVVVALGRDGRPRPGWPIAIPDVTSADAMTFAPDRSLYLQMFAGDQVVLTALRPDGTRPTGWPVRFQASADCRGLSVAGDGTVRLVCSISETQMRAYAFDPTGRALPGWPVTVNGTTSADPRVVGSRLILISEGGGWVRLVAIGRDGTTTLGRRVTVPRPIDGGGFPGRPQLKLGPSGTAYAWWYRLRRPGRDVIVSTTFESFDLAGVKAGWPVTFSGEASEPVIGPNGRVYITRGTQDERPTRIWALDARGRRVAGWPVTLNVRPAIGQGGEGWRQPAPVRLAADGAVYLVTEDRGTTVYALTPTGRVRSGWPYRSARGLGDGCFETAGCGHAVIEPVIDAAGQLRLVLSTSSLYGGELGGRIVMIGRNGQTAAGWPVSIARRSAWFSTLDVRAGITCALATRQAPMPDGSDGRSQTLLTIAVDGTVLYRTTLFMPR